MTMNKARKMYQGARKANPALAPLGVRSWARANFAPLSCEGKLRSVVGRNPRDQRKDVSE